MITEEELIKHKWKYIREYNVWSKLGASFKNADRTLDYLTICFADRLAFTTSASSIEFLERKIKHGAKIIFSEKSFYSMFTTKQKRTIKNWIL